MNIIENQFNTGGVIYYEESIEELNKFIKQTDGLRLSEEQIKQFIDILKNSSSENVEISIP